MSKTVGQEGYIVASESEEESREEEEEEENWDDWRDEDDEEEASSGLLCLFCDQYFGSCNPLFDHCASVHCFDFQRVKEALSLDFYGSFKLINYVRSQVAANICWSCDRMFPSNDELLTHLHETVDVKNIKQKLDDDTYLKPFLQEDSLLYNFDDNGGEDDCPVVVDKEEFAVELNTLGVISIDCENFLDEATSTSMPIDGCGLKGDASVSRNDLDAMGSAKKASIDAANVRAQIGLSNGKDKDKKHNSSSINLAANSVRRVNDSYFGAYSSFGIHREMLSDKVRMEAYSQAILGNTSLFSGAVVMDVGCGTGILSLFAARAGASKVIGVEASGKMAAVATQIAKDNHLWFNDKPNGSDNQRGGIIEIFHGMVEELDGSPQLHPHSVDILLSEWMGYCLLYESMLSSVLYARDRWLKPGGAILPDTATIFAAGFGRGATSLQFWDNIYGFDMSSIGNELVEDAARNPIVDVISESDLVTDPVTLQTFDIISMKHEEVDFTASVELEPSSSLGANESAIKCYGVVLWFETGFTSRVCRETPAVLSTSPYTPKTHWAQTILTFQEPITMLPGKGSNINERLHTAESDVLPAEKIHLRVSIARAPEHRSVDISLEVAAICFGGKTRTYPVQIFNLS
ncbi:hypothetical protein SAY87_032212 [Trapa incisa]|uniref:C2H2-type domain-containing protein n=1 Tax=Trapa incisa TaxID=236973 RepID=A0AAN7QQJ2_9MYRT|nr:hypothetical protein SAY87_032212 [Trapa incisa]